MGEAFLILGKLPSQYPDDDGKYLSRIILRSNEVFTKFN